MRRTSPASGACQSVASTRERKWGALQSVLAPTPGVPRCGLRIRGLPPIRSPHPWPEIRSPGTTPPGLGRLRSPASAPFLNPSSRPPRIRRCGRFASSVPSHSSVVRWSVEHRDKLRGPRQSWLRGPRQLHPVVGRPLGTRPNHPRILHIHLWPGSTGSQYISGQPPTMQAMPACLHA
jgi:hypothetical protein